jgi:S1-C subfamily serine protease
VAAPETVDRDETLIEGRSPLSGLVAANISPAVADEAGLPSTAKGVVALKVGAGPARRYFRPGDIILEVNGVEIDSVATLNAVLAQDGGFWRIAVNRGGRVLKLAVGG